jgi:hypothetical protein
MCVNLGQGGPGLWIEKKTREINKRD